MVSSEAAGQTAGSAPMRAVVGASEVEEATATKCDSHPAGCTALLDEVRDADTSDGCGGCGGRAGGCSSVNNPVTAVPRRPSACRPRPLRLSANAWRHSSASACASA